MISAVNTLEPDFRKSGQQQLLIEMGAGISFALAVLTWAPDGRRSVPVRGPSGTGATHP